MTRASCWLFAATISLSIIAVPAHARAANLLINGSFEADPSPQFGITQLTGWSVYAGTVDLDRDTGVIDGFTDLETTGSPGAAIIGQTFSTIPGQAYLLQGLISHHPGLGTQTAKIDVTINGLFLAELSHGGVTTDFSDLQWHTFDVPFTASSITTDLRMQDVTNLDPFRGAIIDAVSVTAVPEPSSLALLAVSGLALLRRRCCCDAQDRVRFEKR